MVRGQERRPFCAPLVLAILGASCGGSRGARPAAPPTPESSPTPEAPAPADPFATAPAPPGYVEMHVIGVAPVGESNAVVLTDAKRSVVVPIMVGGSEAVAITFRLNDQELPRPITHDLIDTLLARFKARLIKVQVDKLEDGIFYGSIYLVHRGRVIEIDARPSDAIALALGSDAPIYVAEEVIVQAGISAEELGSDRGADDDRSPLPEKMPPPPDVPDALKPKP